MNFIELKNLIKEESTKNDFQSSSDYIQRIIFNLSKEDFIPIVSEIGAIPEDIKHDSSEEKLYTKTSDIVLAKCFIELGLKSSVLKERANCADVIAKSQFHNYSLIGDAKSFRLSRTAKNQKDFKVESMVHWKKDNDYSVLCCPYFQYPQLKSQIYGQALDGNVSLFSWEYFSVLLKNDIKENENINLSILWNFSKTIAQKTTIENKDNCFIQEQNKQLKNILKIDENELNNEFSFFKQNIVNRGMEEIKYWKNEISIIEQYSREKAIDTLIKTLKLNEKINTINAYINKLKD
jgi:type II restriction enzyme